MLKIKKNFKILLITAIAILFWLYLYFIKLLTFPHLQNSLFGSVCFEEHCFQVELAKTETERSKGLMYRENLDKDKGMLFIFEKEGIYPFWMKNTLIPLDIIWIDGNDKIVFISQNVQPCKSLICPTVMPPVAAKYVLELNAGTCQDINLRVGDFLDIKT